MAESFFKTLKTEQMKLDIFEFIEIWYNRKRGHSTLDYKTIEEFWKQKNIFKNVAQLILRLLFADPLSTIEHHYFYISYFYLTT